MKKYKNKNDKRIDAVFTDMYTSLNSRLEKTRRLHYLNVKKLSKGIKIGDIQVTINNHGYVLKKGYNRGYSVIEKNIYTKKAAIMMAIFYTNGDNVKFKEASNQDTKYGCALEKLKFSKERMRQYANEGDWFKVNLFEDRLKTYMHKAQVAKDNLTQLYYNCVF
jgi:hypothetical protein